MAYEPNKASRLYCNEAESTMRDILKSATTTSAAKASARKILNELGHLGLLLLEARDAQA